MSAADMSDMASVAVADAPVMLMTVVVADVTSSVAATARDVVASTEQSHCGAHAWKEDQDHKSHKRKDAECNQQALVRALGGDQD
eukprot:CAMPEP_0183366286 /NCGR_PEP_ID=MMETSP0164_2-20130417/88081_1 /TAXON_ID=221442 /ORGANISM="Coccolithus pelagicus ssp braarudi, Strain PLY182g" /LENGTH=84 /DNA_ID=CAMNT_0025541989 /DNA_START=133 /DNA_END=387 /DNA_ORIENTATION=-